MAGELVKRFFADPGRLRAPLRLDLLRVCAYHNKPWAAIYTQDKYGRYQYTDSIQIRKRLYVSQYASGQAETYIMNPYEIGEEECAWCGIYGTCPHCSSQSDPTKGCGMFFCRGRSSGKYLRCREACGLEGWEQPSHVTVVGIVPRSL
jgi:hypothetical protein